MAKLSDKNSNSIKGNFFVDNRCIGCMSCESFDSDTFVLKNGKAYVYAQPNSQGFENAAIALLSCPVNAIGVQINKEEIRKAKKKLPLKLHEDLYFCSYNSEKTFGSNSYLLKTTNGNILIDSPKYVKPLLEKLEALGGIKYIYLTHKDDIGEYLKFKEYFNAEVIFHENDFNVSIKTADIILSGQEDYILNKNVKIIQVPGHTKGHTVLLYKDKYLFTGDHLAYKTKYEHLYMFKNHCWYDWKKQIASLNKLLNYRFSHLYAGHGANFVTTHEKMKDKIKECLERYS